MSTQEVRVQARFPEENIEARYGRIHIQSMTATVTTIAPPPLEGPTVQVIKVEMSCIGNLDTHTILIEDASILRMFVAKDRNIVIDLSPLNVGMPIFKLEPIGPVPDNDGEEDTDADVEMIDNAWKTCRLVWKHDEGFAELNKLMAMAKRAKDNELAAQDRHVERLGRLAPHPKNLVPGPRRPAHAPPPSKTPRTTLSRLPGAAGSKRSRHVPGQAFPLASTKMTTPARIGGHTLPEPENDAGHWSDAEEDGEGRPTGELASTGTRLPTSQHFAAQMQSLRAAMEEDEAREAELLKDMSDMYRLQGDSAALWQLLQAPLERSQAKLAELHGFPGTEDGEKDLNDDSEEFEDSNEEGDEYEEDKEFGQSLPAKRKRLHGTRKKVSQPSQKRPAKSTTTGENARPRKPKPRNPEVLIWPTTIITTGTAGQSLRPLMEEMGQILTTEAERQQYMDLVWTRRRAADGVNDAAVKQAAIDDLENFVCAHNIVDLHNLWARWMESGVKIAMPMYKPTGTGVMNAAERRKMFERKNKSRKA